MRRGIIALGAVGLLTAAAAVGAATLGPGNGAASSHREAPLIAEDPSADLTDLYAFRSPDKPNTVTILANVVPGEDPAAGPNWYTFSPNARYNLTIDTNGDARPNVTYRFQFRTKTGPFFLGDTAQPYTVTRVAGGKTTVVARGTTPPNNIGPRSTPNYRSLAAKGVVSLAGGGKAFAGQRDDPFFGDIGAIFDLVAIRKGTGNMGGGKDFFAGYGVHTFGVQVPIAGLKAKNGIIGVWSSVDRRKVTTRTTSGASSKGAWIQVNRLANPLVNEVVIPTGLKDQWNGLVPWKEGRFRQYYDSPILAAVINKLYKLGAPENDRDDLVAVLLTGVPNLNFTSPRLAELLRLNLTIPVTKNPNRMGVLAGDNQGWPNGRRLERRRHRHRRAGGGRVPQGDEAPARRRRQRRRPEAPRILPVHRGSAGRASTTRRASSSSTRARGREQARPLMRTAAAVSCEQSRVKRRIAIARRHACGALAASLVAGRRRARTRSATSRSTATRESRSRAVTSTSGTRSMSPRSRPTSSARRFASPAIRPVSHETSR